MSIDLAMARMVAHVIYPEREGEGLKAPEPNGYAALVDACQSNKVPLLSLKRNGQSLAPFYASEAFRRAEAEERAVWQQVRQEYLLVHQAFEATGIKHVLIKSVGLAPSFPYRSDNLDVLVPLEEGRRARRLLGEIGYVELKNIEEPHKFLFRKFHLGSTVCMVHLHEFVGWGTGFMDDANVLAAARPVADDDAILIPSREDGLMVIMAHAFYEDKEVKLGDLWKVMHILREGELDWERIYRQADHRGWRDGIYTCTWLWAELEKRLYGRHSFPPNVLSEAQARAPQDCRAYLQQRLAEPETRFPYRISFTFSKRLYYRKVYRDTFLSPDEKLTDALRHSLAGIKRRLPFKSQRPMLVTLSGIDGCGKTTYVDVLQKAFIECEINNVIVWSRGGSSRLTDRIIALAKPLLARRSGALDLASDSPRARVERKSAWLRRPIVRWGWAALVMADLVLQYWRRVAWPLARGRVVIGDRYTYDALIEMASLMGDAQFARSWAAKIFRWLCPRPKLAYWLDVSPFVAHERKPDEPLAFLQGQADLFRQTALLWQLRAVNVDRELATVADALTHEILRTYYRDWRTWFNGLFLANPIRDA